MTEDNNSTAYKKDVADELENKLAQLSAMLTCIYGVGYDGFKFMSDEVKDNYLWACGAMADDAHDLFQKMMTGGK